MRNIKMLSYTKSLYCHGYHQPINVKKKLPKFTTASLWGTWAMWFTVRGNRPVSQQQIVQGMSRSVLALNQSKQWICHEATRGFWLTRSEAPVLWVYVRVCVSMCLLVGLCVGAMQNDLTLFWVDAMVISVHNKWCMGLGHIKTILVAIYLCNLKTNTCLCIWLSCQTENPLITHKE